MNSLLPNFSAQLHRKDSLFIGIELDNDEIHAASYMPQFVPYTQL